MVQEYIIDRCRYLVGSLKPHIFLLPKETTRIDYLIDNNNCEVRQIIYTDCFKLEGFKTMLNVTESVDNRLDFSTSVTLSMTENWNETWIELLNLLKFGRYYVVVEDYNGVQYLQTPEFTAAFNYNYTFNSNTGQGNIAELIFNCDCNMPVIILDSNITPSLTYSNNCGYNEGAVNEFRLSPYQYVLIDSDNETGEFTTITCTNGETMHKIEFTKGTFQFTQQYDGKKYTERLVFRIPLSDYKYYFRYNLVEFKDNRYAAIFKTTQGNWIASGFEFGFQPTYTVETSDNVEELNFIEFTLNHIGQNSVFFTSSLTLNDSQTGIYVPVTQMIKDPITGLNLPYYECLNSTTAIYTLVQMVTISGVKTDRYMCLEGYEETYRNLNIIDTYTQNTEFDFDLTFPNSDCATLDNCKFFEMTKDVYVFNKAGEYYEAHISNNCPWTLNNIPFWIICNRLSGNGMMSYIVRFTCRQNPTSQRIISYATLTSGSNTTPIQFILEQKTQWVNPIEHHITAKNQTVTSYVDLPYNLYDICEMSPELTAQKVPGTSTVRITVPENTDELVSRHFTVKICNLVNGEDCLIHIYQDHLYVRWEDEVNNFVCVEGNSYKVQRKYKGYDSENINILTNETRLGSQLIGTDPNCQFDEGDVIYRWNDNTGETICMGPDKYAREDYEMSTDDGETWTKTGDYRIGELIEASSADCAEPQYKWEIDDTRWICVGTTSYYYEVKYQSTDGETWIKVDPEVIQVSSTVRLENDEECGSSEMTYRWIEDGDNYICDYPDITPEIQTRWIEMPYSVYECDGYDKYNVEKEQRSTDGGVTWDDTGNTRMGNTLIEANSTDCGYSGITEEWRTESDAYLCDNGNKYQSEIRYYWDGEWKTDGERRTGTLIESNSTECTGLSSDSLFLFQVCDKTNYECVNNVKIYKATKKISQDGGIVWTQQGTSCSIDTRGDSVDSCTILTRWVVIPNEYVCVGYDKHSKEKEQSSSNGGTTWTDTGNTRTGAIIEQNSTDCGYVPTTYETQYLTFEFLESGSLNIVASNASVAKDISYSTDNGTTWNTITTSTTSQSLGNFTTGDKLLIKGNNSAYATSNNVYNHFTGTTRVNVYGNIMSLIYGDNFIGQTTISSNYALTSIFDYCRGIVSAENLKLPATTLTQNCYSHMFSGCTSLVTAPSELPSATLANYCYYEMFRGCSSLTATPTLPATTLATNCYDGMFSNCTSLVTAPALSATTLKSFCYSTMFSGCTSLVTAPTLSATTLKTYCYYGMFLGCTSLVTAPVLPATTLSTACYHQMFDGCSSLNYIKAMFTTTPSSSYTTNWVRGVASSGTFVKNSAASWSETGDNGVPSGWTVQTASS